MNRGGNGRSKVGVALQFSDDAIPAEAIALGDACAAVGREVYEPTQFSLRLSSV